MSLNIEFESMTCLEKDGKSKGYVVVKVTTHDSALKAVETLNNLELEGRGILCRLDQHDY